MPTTADPLRGLDSTKQGNDDMRMFSRQRGVSLIEVMMALLIFSIGMIGAAGLLVMSTRSNQSAYLRTQVTYLAKSMADRMRANPQGVWDGKYDGSYPTTTTKDCSTTGCTADQLAQHDQGAWSSQLKTFLPMPSATIKCDAGSAGYTPSATQISMAPPYGGNYHMTIKWSEQQEGDQQNRSATTSAFDWDFQP